MSENLERLTSPEFEVSRIFCATSRSVENINLNFFQECKI